MTKITGIKQLFHFWLPLQATWLMMAIETPFLAAIIARMAEPKHNLAAYGVAYALAIIIEAPIIMMMSAATALVDSSPNYKKLRNFTWFLNVAITLTMIVVPLTALWPFLADTCLNLDPEVSRLSRIALIILIPWPAAIGWRRLCQGILIRSDLTRRVAWGTGVRLVTMLATAILIWQFTNWPGVILGACSLSVGVIAETLATWLMVRTSIKELDKTAPGKVLTYREINQFYYPLALTSLISLVAHPLVTFFMGHARYSLESLAVLPVVNSLTFIFRTPGLSFQEAAITMLSRDKNNTKIVVRFATYLGIGATLGLALIALTPLSRIWFGTISGLSVELTSFALLPAQILVLIPALSVLLSLQRSLLVVSRQTSPITWASALEVGGIVAVLTILVVFGHWVGATAAAVAFVVGRSFGNVYLIKSMRQNLKLQPAVSPDDRA